jgi:2-C-methyl-D-erythritol 4-phosphate cytidylyltransferase/2-C-methyl-D-erythritol 2,4-cyclodiphosphate synthase
MAGKLQQVSVLIVAGGSSRRMGGDIPKPYRMLAGKPLLAHTLAAFLAHPDIAQVQVAIRAEDTAHYTALAPSDPRLLPPITGGAERQDSVRIGLEALAAHAPTHVLIHDAARPLLSRALIDRILAALSGHDAVMPALPVVDTLRNADGGDVPREGLLQVQTPQAFPFAALLAAHRATSGQTLTDDIAVLRAHQPAARISTVEGERRNLKITTSADMIEAEGWLRMQHQTRVAMGYDVHRLIPHPPATPATPAAQQIIMLGGVPIPHASKLEGHSDADVVLHALTDALLGAIGAGDIGTHFPPTEAAWRGKDSAHFVTFARDMLAAQGGELTHADITLLAEAPKIGPHREAMRARIAELLAVSPAQVSVKATTTEGLGFVGRKEGIAAQVVVTVLLPL